MKRSSRNLHVEKSVEIILEKIDSYINGGKLKALPEKSIRDAIEVHLKKNGGSVKVASLFLLAYSLVDTNWNKESIPTGIRGKYGDKLLAAELTDRHITFHNNITAFGENLGWKGNVTNINLSNDPRFHGFIDLFSLNVEHRKQVFEYVCSIVSETRVVPKAIPKLPENYLTYAKSVQLFTRLLSIPSEGHIQQFVVAAFLFHHRARFGIDVLTHHPHASDKFDSTYGDIEEFSDDRLIMAYEVTVRTDWKNRLPDLRTKMNEAGLQKYVLIASDVNRDAQLSNPDLLVNFTENAGFDLAIVDLSDFTRVFCAELKASEIRDVLNTCYGYLLNPKLCGRNEIISSYRDCVDLWLDS